VSRGQRLVAAITAAAAIALTAPAAGSAYSETKHIPPA